MSMLIPRARRRRRGRTSIAMSSPMSDPLQLAGREALVVQELVTGEVAVFDQPLGVVAACEVDDFVVAHFWMGVLVD